MRKRFAFAAVAVLVLAGSMFLLWKKGVLFPARPEQRVVATVNGKPITLGEFSRRFATFLASLKLPAGDRRPRGELRQRFLSKMADAELLRQEAAARGISVPAAEVEKELAILRQDLAGEGKGGPEDEERLARWKDDLADKLLFARLALAAAGTVAVSDGEVGGYYAANPTEFNRPPMARARQIVTATEAAARALRERALRGEDFAALASASIAPEGEKGGDLGLFAQGEMPEEIDTVVFSLPAGAISRVVRSPYGWHLIRVEERLPARTLSLPDATPEIRARLAAIRREEAFSRWATNLRASARIVLFPERLEDPSADERP